MANLIVRKEKENQVAAPLSSQFEPLRAMRRLLSWDPFREMGLLSSPFFDDQPLMAFTPAFEVKETNGTYVFKADVPGLTEKDIDITLTGNRLTISGKREAENEERTDTFYTYERSYGSFVRSFTLPQGTDMEHIKAEVKDGVLSLVVPKTPEAQPKKIAIGSVISKS